MPPSPQGTVQEQLVRQYSYLFQMAQQLNVALGQLESGGTAAPSGGTAAPAAREQQYFCSVFPADIRLAQRVSERFTKTARSRMTRPNIFSFFAIIPARRSPWARLAWECSAPPGGGCCSGASTPSPPPLSAFSSAGGRAAAKLRSNRRGGRRTLVRRSAARSPPQGRQYCRSAHM